MSTEDIVTGTAPAPSPIGLVTQSPFSFALLLVGLYWVHKLIRGIDLSRPPRAPYLIPWIGSAMEMWKDPDLFFSNMTKIFGPIFRVKAFGREMVFVTSPSLISQVYGDSQSFDFLAIRIEMGPTISTYLSSIHDTILGIISSMDGASGPLKTFIIPPAYRAAAQAAVGTDFPAEKTWKGFQVFDESMHMLRAGLPKFILRTPLKAWDDVVNIIEEYIVGNEDRLEELGPFVQTGIDGRQDNWTSHDIATILAVQLWALEANLTWAIYWLIAELLRQPEGLIPLVVELDSVHKQWQAAHPTVPLGPAFFDEVIVSSPERLPLLTSAIQETFRHRSSMFSMRRVTSPVMLGGYQLRPGEKVVCATRQVHLDAEVRPDAEEFDIRQYLELSRPIKNGKPVSNHSMPFGGGVSAHGDDRGQAVPCHFSDLRILEIDGGCMTRPQVVRERMGLGIMHPKGDMDVILRKRKL